MSDMVHPYIPNSVPQVKQEMLRAIGAPSTEDLYSDIPEELRFRRMMNLPQPIAAECDLVRHVMGILGKNQTCEENISFLGGGCARHYVPAICDEINGRSEFLTAYAGEPYEDHGRFQALFEYQSLMAEVLDVDVVNVPTYDWGQAASTALRMASRIVGRNTVLVSDTVSPERLAVMTNYCTPALRIVPVAHSRATGMMDLADLGRKISGDTAAVYFENPSFLGPIETEGEAIAEIAHQCGALLIVGADPASLGVMVPPARYGCDLVCGDIQPLGIHMHYGGGLGGFIGCRDEERFVMEYPFRLFGIARTSVPGEWGFGDVAYDRTSFAQREEGREFVGTAAALWAITAGVYLSLMGPKGMRELGTTIMQKSQYAMARLSDIPGVKAPAFDAPHFKEFVVDFSGTGRTVRQINEHLLAHGIFGGQDLSGDFPELGQSALYCVTELHTQEQLECLADALGCAVKGDECHGEGA
ncbi:MAG TPA: aminomethyl-transferring glycine dehydrogenase subunit GcvPA [Bacillota bacterium]|nr:aminomethyl-transferring glycine dehydrogenase subunit GcvPA [Bacillota bacterium]HNY67909.1 aminomethyl-transferring glycine dehydrogenase subunit GcvPA [Bacillota bacterium]HOI36733.1 aminomethyl-transferring glycine dehydrogenase subunit GcvPA [Bacillota bacterium]HPU74888.1 aminomethyl-transferring glycine dehydrogenase subunit GcvPA [Bacillota bacterium]